jgi:hypothetical protein
MRVEWGGQVAPAESVAAGTCVMFVHRRQTQVGIRADDKHGQGLEVRGLVSFTSGYDGRPNQPAFFDLSILRGNRTVYALPDACLALPTERGRIHPGQNGGDWAAGALAQQQDDLFLAVAYNAGIRFLNLTNGMFMKEWPPSDEVVWFSAWRIVRRLGDDCRSLFDFTLNTT